MSSFHIRPRFTQIVDTPTEAIQEQIVSRLSEECDQCTVLSFPNFVAIRIAEEDRHFWSPRLMLSFYEEEGGKTSIKGIYGPSSNVWGVFLYSYLMVGFLAVIASVMAISQWAIGKPVTWLWIAAAAGAALVVIYIIAQVGQKLGVQHTFRLHQAYEAAVGEQIEIK